MFALSACKVRDDQPAPASTPPGAVRSDAAPSDAAPDAPVDAMPERARRALRLAGYLELLSIDHWTFELLAAFPGVPDGTKFFSLHYSQWEVPLWMTLDTLRDHLAAVQRAADAQPRLAADDAVLAYLAVHARWLPRVLDLNEYYRSSHFVDDEFDRARREAGDVATARTELAAVRGVMWQRVLEAWRELSGDVPDSPRAIVGRAWESCFRVQDLVMAEPYDERRVATAVSACRRAIPTVTALPRSLRGELDDHLRGVAIKLGDSMVGVNHWDGVTGGLAALTTEYLALWPSLPTTPAERAAP